MSKQPNSLQLYTLRRGLKSSVAATLARVASQGFQAVELYHLDQCLSSTVVPEPLDPTRDPTERTLTAFAKEGDRA
jgi:hypothetical protein